MRLRKRELLFWFMEAMALGALCSSSEISIWAPLIPIALLASSLLIQRDWITGLLSLLAVGSATAATLTWGCPPLLAAAYGTFAIHGALWFSRAKFRGWRQSLGLIELLLATSLSSAISLMPFIFGFVLASCYQILLNHSGPSTYASKSKKRDLALITALFTATGLCIFPLLPRLELGSSLGSDSKNNIGYTEEVNVSEWNKTLDGTDGVPVLRLVSPTGDDLLTSIYLGLIRGRVLDHFDGSNWTSRHPQIRESHRAVEPKARLLGEGIRQNMATDILPLPYGTISVETLSNEAVYWPAENRKGGQWTDPRNGERVEYRFEFDPFHGKIFYQDEPGPEYLAVPAAFANLPRVKKLVQELYRPHMSPAEKIQSLRNWIILQHFTASLEAPRESERRTSSSPVEAFLFETHRGHCELFSTAAALLLRLGGIPARLISGFRITHAPVGGVLTVYSTDAHAWLEFHEPERGWLPWDPTPRVLGAPGINAFAQLQEWAGWVWDRYIVSFGSRSDLRGLGSSSTAIPLACILILALLLVRYREHRFGMPEREREMAQVRRKLEQLRLDSTASEARGWTRKYDELRFGRPVLNAGERRKRIRDLAREITG